MARGELGIKTKSWRRHSASELFPPLYYCAYSLEDGQNVRRASHTTRNITNLTAHEKAPAALLLTRLRQLLEPEKLSDGTPIAREQNLMQRPVLLRRPNLKARLVTRNGREVLPDPPNHVLGLLDTAKVVRQDVLVGLEGLLVERGVLGVPACADKENVAEVDFGSLVAQAGL